MFVAGAIEVENDAPARLRLSREKFVDHLSSAAHEFVTGSTDARGFVLVNLPKDWGDHGRISWRRDCI